MTEEKYPMRINKYLAFKNLASRREADGLIEKGLVKINGKRAKLGDKVGEKDRVEVDQKAFQEKNYLYLAFHKPRGVVSHSPKEREKSVADFIDLPEKVFPVGRLDKDSDGLLILTNDGRITDKILNPDFYHEKEYVVKVDREMSPSFLRHMEEGVELGDGYTTRPCQVEKIDRFTFRIILTEGKKRQIRRMCEKLGRGVVSLERVRLMNVLLGNLRPGQFRKLKGKELTEFLGGLGIGVPKNLC